MEAGVLWPLSADLSFFPPVASLLGRGRDKRELSTKQAAIGSGLGSCAVWLLDLTVNVPEDALS